MNQYIFHKYFPCITSFPANKIIDLNDQWYENTNAYFQTIAQSFDIDLSAQTYNKDKAGIELNFAVHHSYNKANVAIVDHHTVRNTLYLCPW